MFGIIKQIFIVLLTSIINTSSIGNASNHTKCVFLSKQKYEIQPASQGIQSRISLLSIYSCIRQMFYTKLEENTEDLNLSVFNMIA